MSVSISPVAPEHLEQILELEKLCFSLPWTVNQLENQMKNENCVFLAATDENENLVGYAGFSWVLDEGYISNIAVSPKARKQGTGSALVRELIARGRAHNLAFLTLEVRESNLSAIALYKKHGFHEVGKRPNYYEKPREAAVLMTLFYDKGSGI